VAEEAAVIAEVMGCKVIRGYDVGVAGIHRLLEPLKLMISEGVACVVVVAGMEGALPSVVAGIVPVPVIGVLTASYGLGSAASALTTMLSPARRLVVGTSTTANAGDGCAIAMQSHKK
jgi:NCAIR mutase (PurE)-related protein